MKYQVTRKNKEYAHLWNCISNICIYMRECLCVQVCVCVVCVCVVNCQSRKHQFNSVHTKHVK